MSQPPSPKLRLRLVYEDLRLGPGKTELLRLIEQTGSISAAGRAMEMSYKRAWGLVEEMNAAFPAPLVLSLRGGAKGGGASLSPLGQEVLACLLALEDSITRAAQPHIADLARLRGATTGA